MNYFVTAIDTDSGKTLVSAILCEALQADYWKPVQAGLPRDADTVKSLLTNTRSRIHPETYLLSTPASPHAAAKIEGITLAMEKFVVPETPHDLVTEGAGGCLVPLNDHNFVIDIAARLKMTLVLVSDLYLGSINHTLLTFEAIQKRNVAVKGIIFNGDSNAESERIILHHTKLKKLLHIKRESSINPETVSAYAKRLKETWHE